MSRQTIAPFTILVLGACNTEQAYQDLIQNHGVTWDTTAASTGDFDPAASTTSGVPTTSGGGSGSGAGGSSTGATPTSGETDTDGTPGPQVDQAPVLVEFSVTPDPVQSAMFVELAATCEDDIGVTEVRFFVDDTPLTTVAAPPFTAQWPVKSTDEDGPRALRVECEDTAGHVVFEERMVDVALPGASSLAWADLHPSEHWASEALDASAAPDGSWWVCGYDSDGDGGAAMWVAHYAASGALLFDELISRGPNFYGTCSGIEAFPGDPHRAALTGSWIKDGLSPTLWVGVVDETQQDFLVAKHEDDFLGEVGNDVAVTPEHQIRVTGYRIAGNMDYNIIYRAFAVERGHLSYAGGDEYAGPTDTDDKRDVGEGIVVLPDGRSLIAGRTVSQGSGESRGIVAIIGTDHEIVEGDGYPFVSQIPLWQHEAFSDLEVTADGLVAVAGWWREKIDLPARPRLVHFKLTDPTILMEHTEKNGNWAPFGEDFEARSLARLSTGPVMVAASRRDPVVKSDIWLNQYTEWGWNYEPSPAWPKTYAGFFQGDDAPHAIRVNALDEFLVVGFETIKVLKNGKPVTVRQAWLRAYHG